MSDPLSLSQRFTLILDGLSRAAAARAAQYWAIGPIVITLSSYLRRLTLRFDRLLARYQVGRLTPPRPRRPKPAAPPATDATDVPGARPGRPLPGSFGWLHHMGYEFRLYGSQLQYLVDDPDMADFLALPQVRRMLRPLRRMLGHAPDQPAAQDSEPALRPKRPRAPSRPAKLSISRILWPTRRRAAPA